MNAPPGTYWYHSHVDHQETDNRYQYISIHLNISIKNISQDLYIDPSATQRGNGLQGAMVIKDKQPLYPDVIDIPDKQMIILQVESLIVQM